MKEITENQEIDISEVTDTGSESKWELHVLPDANALWFSDKKKKKLKVSQWCGLGYIKSDGKTFPVYCKPAYTSLDLKEMLEYISSCEVREMVKKYCKKQTDKKNEKKWYIIDSSEKEWVIIDSSLEDNELTDEMKAVSNFVKAVTGEELKKPFYYAFNMPTLFEIYAACAVFMALQGTGYTVCTQETKKVFDPPKKECTQETKQESVSANTELYIDGEIIPDIVIKKDGKPVAVYDVKYKSGEITKHTRDDRLQILAYALMENVRVIGHIFPGKSAECKELSVLSGEKLRYREFCCNKGCKPGEKEIKRHLRQGGEEP